MRAAACTGSLIVPGSEPRWSLYERHDLRRELLERVARHSPAARSTPSSCVIQHAATD